ncbi:MAG: hypothetical protein K0S93_58 [Nitrososphaeraceae archaeon]|jgi:hypothetical protein|nr:hypothetical protein [Nitrososphaeraceae archaeon]
MQSINIISKNNDIEAVRQLIGSSRSDLVPTSNGILIPNELLNGHKLGQLRKGGFRLVEIGSHFTTVI